MMAKRTVIEDSDDDDGDGHEGHEDDKQDDSREFSGTGRNAVPTEALSLSENIESPCNGDSIIAQMPCETLSSAEKSGSGSTGRLHHELRQAHQTLIETTPHAAIDISPKGRSLSQEVLGSPGVDGSRKRKRRSRSLGDGEIRGQLPAPNSSASIVSPSKTIPIENAIRPPASQETDHENESRVWTDLQPPSENLRPAVLVPHRPSARARTDIANEEFGAEHSDRGRSRKKLKRQKFIDNAADDSESDKSDIGLPLERYQPRPSRTRSGRADDDLVAPVDFSKRPEKVGKDTKKAGKEKATNLEIFEDQPVTKITHERVEASNGDGDGFAIKDLKGKRGVNENSNNRDKAVYTLQSDSQEKVDAEPPPPPPKKPRGRPKKVTENVVTEISNFEEGKARQKTNPDSDFTGEGQERGSDPKIISNVSILEEKPANAGTVIHEDEALHMSSPSKAVEAQPKTPDKPLKAGQKGPDKHSPINNGKVAYRVGLSKRARIEPLLRIVRK